jgi:hypothetical protein
MRKLLSFFSGLIVASIAVSATNSMWAGLLAAVALAAVKELWDYWKTKNPNFFEFIAVILGGLAATFGLFFWL